MDFKNIVLWPRFTVKQC